MDYGSAQQKDNKHRPGRGASALGDSGMEKPFLRPILGVCVETS
jgi:hypothetical protein